MRWVNSFVYKLILMIILTIIVINGDHKKQHNNKKIKQIKNKYRYEANQQVSHKSNRQYYKKHYKQSSSSKDKHQNHKHKKSSQTKHSSKNKYQQQPKQKKIKKQQKDKKYIKLKQQSISPPPNKKKQQIIEKNYRIIDGTPKRKNNINNTQNRQIANQEIKIQSTNTTVPNTINYIQQEQSKEKSRQTVTKQEIKKEKEIQIQIEAQSTSDTEEQQIVNQCNEKAVYDYNLLVLTWVPTECYADKDCEKDWLTAEDLRSPTIHMFKPFGSSSYYQNCFKEKGDENCRTNAYMTDSDFDYDEALRNTSGLLYDMSQFWPAQKFTHDDQAFYAKQWLNHGTCYLMNMIQDNQNAYKMDKSGFNRTIMIEYFRTAIQKFKKLKIDVQPGTKYSSKQQFAIDIGFRSRETHFVISCNNKNQILEITFCYNRSKLPGRQVTIPCTFDDNCDEDQPLKIKQPL